MNFKINLHTRVKIMNALVRSRLTYSCQSWNVTKTQLNRISSAYCSFLRKMIKGGYRRKADTWNFVLSNDDLLRIGNTENVVQFIGRQQRNYAAHIIWKDNTSISKRLMFNDDQRKKPGRFNSLLSSAIENARCSPDEFLKNAINRKY